MTGSRHVRLLVGVSGVLVGALFVGGLRVAATSGAVRLERAHAERVAAADRAFAKETAAASSRVALSATPDVPTND